MSAVFARVPATMKISDLQTGFRILSGLSLANSQQAVVEMNQFLDSLLQSPPAADVYLQLLEQTRISLCFIEEDLARRYINKPLPLGASEEAAFQEVVTTWLKAARAYSHCAQLQSADDSAQTERLALILHRCIYYTGMAVIEHHRARRELPGGLWLDLHGFYASAEEWGVATLSVPDSLDPLGRSTHCTAAFVGLLLIELAGPYSLSVRELGLVRRWASHWSPLVSMHTAVPGEPLPTYVVDLMRDTGLCASSACLQPENLRRLDPSRLTMQINEMRRQLQQRISPAQLGLGEDCTAAQCQRLLRRLAGPWSLLRAARRFRRHNASGISKVCSGLAGIHFSVSGKEFNQPESARIYSRQEFDSLFAFRHMADPTRELVVRQAQLGFAVDDWEVLDQCANGFRLSRSNAGRKLAPGQLLSLCPHDGNAHFLAQLVWLRQEQDGGLVAGIAALPGRPQAIAARPMPQTPGHGDPYSRAFLLPAVSAIGVEQTLVIPQGWYYAERLLQIYHDSVAQVKLQRLVAAGPDFERVTFIVV
ncbi:conserved hypothetical protein [Candidatus Accumulibacter aalborgensis]|uniref:Molecular chaperone n=1 Tax=Candidatus Accumulibacter aalborgensis TaxID=1860102 RepID=A0A1A8XW78_9PROT|nr:hypothetical protein [Candidatus Accumulibacter aalborgensis]SBT08971.1 conserved hypothetical protein [Candidatus Accumulibacter aalborgensis]